MPVFNIQHITRYEYDEPVKERVNELRLYPLADAVQEVLSHTLFITSDPAVTVTSDYWGNDAGLFNILQTHTDLTIESRLFIRTTDREEPMLNSLATIDDVALALRENYKLIELAQPTGIDSREELQQILASIVEPGMTIAMIISRCCQYIFENFAYIQGITSVTTTVSRILEIRSGVCQDFTHVLLELLRYLGIPSRYVSGYICPNRNGMRGEGATHAWAEAWIPGLGWTGIDPTNNVWVTSKHIKLAVGRNFNDCSPVKGTYKGTANETLSVFVSVGYESGGDFHAINTAKFTQPQQRLIDQQQVQQQ